MLISYTFSHSLISTNCSVVQHWNDAAQLSLSLSLPKTITSINNCNWVFVCCFVMRNFVFCGCIRVWRWLIVLTRRKIKPSDVFIGHSLRSWLYHSDAVTMQDQKTYDTTENRQELEWKKNTNGKWNLKWYKMKWTMGQEPSQMDRNDTKSIEKHEGI